VPDLADVRAIALALPRAYEAIVRDYVKFRVGRIVFASVSPDESLLGFGYPRDARESLVASNPDVFLMPVASDLRYQWVRLRLTRVDPVELTELITGAWEMCVPKSVARAHLDGLG
jgi:hypothetical protein